jgi:hypothetical protein
MPVISKTANVLTLINTFDPPSAADAMCAIEPPPQAG